MSVAGSFLEAFHLFALLQLVQLLFLAQLLDLMCVTFGLASSSFEETAVIRAVPFVTGLVQTVHLAHVLAHGLPERFPLVHDVDIAGGSHEFLGVGVRSVVIDWSAIGESLLRVTIRKQTPVVVHASPRLSQVGEVVADRALEGV